MPNCRPYAKKEVNVLETSILLSPAPYGLIQYTQTISDPVKYVREFLWAGTQFLKEASIFR